MKNDTILVTGACGQIGSELVLSLRKIYKNVIASDLKEPSAELKDSGEFFHLDVLYKNGLADFVNRFKITQVYHLAAILLKIGRQRISNTENGS